MNRTKIAATKPALSFVAGAALAGMLLLGACSSSPEPAPEAVAPAAAPTEAMTNADASAANGTAAEDETAPAATDLLPTPTPAQEPETQPQQPAASPAPAQLSPDQITLDLQPVATGLNQPLFVTHAGDGSGRLFIVEKPGVIRIMRDGQLLDAPFLDIRDRVGSSGSEQGLLGLAFPPDFTATGHFFVNYTDLNGHTVVARYQVQPELPDAADAAAELIVLQIDQPASNHNGGMLAFGPDGYLYIGTGDGGAAFDRFGNGQNPDTLLGKMLRIDVTSDTSMPYLIPPDNPWAGAETDGPQVRDEIWAFGLRNPWRYSFDRLTGDLWIADVGQNRYEEINVTPAGSSGGLNYGWPIQEGSACIEGDACDRSGLEQPILEYDHSGHCSVTGGYVYRGGAYPALQGVYFYGDYCSGAIWAAAPVEGDGWQSALVMRSGLLLSSFGEDEAGESYLTDIAGGGVYRLGLAE